jgi:hypothetical protein
VHVRGYTPTPQRPAVAADLEADANPSATATGAVAAEVIYHYDGDQQVVTLLQFAPTGGSVATNARTGAFRVYDAAREVSRPHTGVWAGRLATKGATEGIYVVRGGRGTYVGQSGNLPGRAGRACAERALHSSGGRRGATEGGLVDPVFGPGLGIQYKSALSARDLSAKATLKRLP